MNQNSPSPLGRGGTARRRGPHVLRVVGVRGLLVRTATAEVPKRYSLSTSRRGRPITTREVTPHPPSSVGHPLPKGEGRDFLYRTRFAHLTGPPPMTTYPQVRLGVKMIASWGEVKQ